MISAVDFACSPSPSRNRRPPGWDAPFATVAIIRAPPADPRSDWSRDRVLKRFPSCSSPISRLATRSGPGGEPALSGHPIVAIAIAGCSTAYLRKRSCGRRRVAPTTSTSPRARRSFSEAVAPQSTAAVIEGEGPLRCSPRSCRIVGAVLAGLVNLKIRNLRSLGALSRIRCRPVPVDNRRCGCDA